MLKLAGTLSKEELKWQAYRRKYYFEHKAHLTELMSKRRSIKRKEINAYKRAYYHLNKDRLIKSKKIGTDSLKVEVLTHYGNGECACVKCSFNDIRALSIDHINGKGTDERKLTRTSGFHFYAQLRRSDFPKGYQTLCMNCQFIKRVENHEYYLKLAGLQ